MTHPTTIQVDQDKFDDQIWEVIILIKIIFTNDQLPWIPSGKFATNIWNHLKELHETFDKIWVFFIKNQLLSIKMDERMSLQ